MPIVVEKLAGADRMAAEHKDHVLLKLRQLDMPATHKRYLFARWCGLVKCPVKLSDLDGVAKLVR